MRKPDFCTCENKDADQLRGNREADRRLCFRYIASTIKSLAIFCGCTARFVSDLVGNPEDRFSHNEVQIMNTKGLHFTRQRSAKALTGHLEAQSDPHCSSDANECFGITRSTHVNSFK